MEGWEKTEKKDDHLFSSKTKIYFFGVVREEGYMYGISMFQIREMRRDSPILTKSQYS